MMCPEKAGDVLKRPDQECGRSPAGSALAGIPSGTASPWEPPRHLLDTSLRQSLCRFLLEKLVELSWPQSWNQHWVCPWAACGRCRPSRRGGCWQSRPGGDERGFMARCRPDEQLTAWAKEDPGASTLTQPSRQRLSVTGCPPCAAQPPGVSAPSGLQVVDSALERCAPPGPGVCQGDLRERSQSKRIGGIWGAAPTRGTMTPQCFQ